MKIYISLILIITMIACIPNRYKNIFTDYNKDQFIVAGTTNKCLKENLPWLHEMIENRHMLRSLRNYERERLMLFLSNKGIEKFRTKGTNIEMMECGCFKTKDDFFSVFGKTYYSKNRKYLLFELRDIQNLSKLGEIAYEKTLFSARWTKNDKLLIELLTY